MQMQDERLLAGEDTRWHVVYTRHQHERTVAAHLVGRGFEVFHATYRTMHRWKDRNKEVELPLFPGYLFFADGLDRRVEILSTPGVHMILSVGNIPAVIPNEEIDAIRRAANSSLGLQPHPFLSEGDVVRVKSGPLAGVEGILQRQKDLFRLVLSIQILGRAAAVEIDIRAVERITQSRVLRTNVQERITAYGAT
jgi:transcription antitermination factor NusG